MTYPREWASQIEISPDAPLGRRWWRASGSFGGTARRPFLVGDLPELIETESNSSASRAERLTLPVVVNGQIAGERDLDFYVFSANVGDVVVCDMLAARIASPLDPVIEIFNARGERQLVDEIRAGSDPIVAFRVPETGDYRVSISNVSFSGGSAYVYRMTVSTAPLPVYAFPAGGQVGETRRVRLFSLSGQGAPSLWEGDVTFPAAPGEFSLQGSVPLIAGTGPELEESQGNVSADAAMPLPVPGTVSGRFMNRSEEDWFAFPAKRGERFAIACRPFPETSSAIPSLVLSDGSGARLARCQGLDGATPRCELEWEAPSDGTYRLCLRDLQHGTQGGANFLYRLSVEKSQPGFSLTVEPDYVNVVQAGRTEVDLIVHRTGGFVGPIDLSASDLPQGVKIEPAQIPAGQPRIKLAFVAEDSARPVDATVALQGQAMIGDQARKETAAVRGVLPSASHERLCLTVQHKPMFRITCSEAYQYAHRGTVYPYAMQIERLNGFDGPVTIQLADRQVQDLDGIDFIQQVVPPGVSEFGCLVFLPESMHVSVQHHSRPYAQGYATFVDQWGQKQAILAVCEKRCMIRTMPTLVRLRAADPEIFVRRGSTKTVRVALDRTAAYPDEMQIELVPRPGITASPVRIKAGASEGAIDVHVDETMSLQPGQTLAFRATGRHFTGAEVVTEATVKLRCE